MRPEPTPQTAPQNQALRQRAEDSLNGPTGHTAAGAASPMPAHQLERALHELRVHQVELEMQNVELRRMQIALESSRASFSDLYENAPVGYVSVSHDGRIVQVNLAAMALLCLPRDSLLQRPVSDFIDRDDQDAFYLLRKKALVTCEPETAELRLRKPDGQLFWAQLMATAGSDDNGTPLLRVVLNDISQRKATQDQLSLAASVFSQAREGIMITDIQGHILDVNDAFSRITGYERGEVLGRTPRLLNSGRQSPEYFAAMWRDLLAKGHWYGEIWNRRKNGEVYAELQTITTVRDSHGRPTHYVSLFSDITTFKAHQSQLEHLAHYDLLTNLPNRALLADRLRQSMAQALRHDEILAVAYIDLDSFKTVNDQHGHEVGDQLLMALAKRMQDTLRQGDTLARMGGDEFVAVLTDLPEVASSLPMLQRLLAAASMPFQLGALQLQVSASLGVTYFPQTEGVEGVEAVEADQLLRQADQAMYQAKQTGKNRYHLFDQAQDRSVRGRHAGLKRVRQALAGHELVLHYQPKVNMRSGAVVGAEALIRWQHPQQGLLAPADFLPLIETDPLAIEVGEWVINTALRQIAHWQAAGLHLPVSVNVGALQLQQPNFVARLQAILRQHPTVAAASLSLEMLETSALQDIGYASQVIEDCQQMGVAFALDDFGTGYSSLTYLKRLRATVLKIDQSFVRDMLDDPDDRCILEGVIGLARAFNRQVIAEGVETVRHGCLLLQLGCDLAQGYGIARPMPASDLPAWVASWRPDPLWRDPHHPHLQHLT